MWNGKRKAVTFSFDDGIRQDIRAIEILDRYGLKATFNLNSAKFGADEPYECRGKMIERITIAPDKVRAIYKNHEVGVHTQSHYNLTRLSEASIIWQVEEDRKALERLVGYDIRCMAYPCGGVNNDERVADIIRSKTSIRFARTITSSYNFDLQENLYRFRPTVYLWEVGKIFNIAERFLKMESEKPQLFYIWGHTYEFDSEVINWEKFETFCKLIANKKDVFYGTNSEVIFNG